MSENQKVDYKALEKFARAAEARAAAAKAGKGDSKKGK
jgi:hypothetical protein